MAGNAFCFLLFARSCGAACATGSRAVWPYNLVGALVDFESFIDMASSENVRPAEGNAVLSTLITDTTIQVDNVVVMRCQRSPLLS